MNKVLYFFFSFFLLIVLNPCKVSAATYYTYDYKGLASWTYLDVASSDLRSGDIIDMGNSNGYRYEVINVTNNINCKLLGRGTRPDYVFDPDKEDMQSYLFNLYPPSVYIHDLVRVNTIVPGSDYVGEECIQVVKLANNAFQNDKYLEKIEIDNISVIPKSFCKNCKNLKEVSINGTGALTVKKDAFYGCKKMTDFSIHDRKIKKIEKNAFKKAGKNGIRLGCKYFSRRNKYANMMLKAGAKKVYK